jgi:hypothetical protein
MRSHFFLVSVARRCLIRRQALRRGAARLAYLGCVPFCLLMLASGCTQQKTAVEHADVKGRVLYKGQPLPGGRVEFILVQGGSFAATANIDENGNYQISAPVGEVQIAVDNTMLKPQRGKKEPHLNRPGSDVPVHMAGHYVAIPEKYYTTDESGLTYKVEPQTQTHDITLE